MQMGYNDINRFHPPLHVYSETCLEGTPLICTVEPVLEDHPISHKYVFPDTWSLVTMVTA